MRRASGTAAPKPDWQARSRYLSVQPIPQFANAVKTLMQQRGLGMNELAILIGTDLSTVSNWSRGSSTPTLWRFLDFCQKVGVTPNEMLGYGTDSDLHRKRKARLVERVLAVQNEVAALRQEVLNG